MFEKEKLIKEQRLIEATQKNYLGLGGKFGIILNFLGQSVISQNSPSYNVTNLENIYEYQDDDNLPIEDPDMPISEIGKMFDALKFGYNLEITYLLSGTIPTENEFKQTVRESAGRVLKVLYNGYIVYLEAEGELLRYVPSNEWEDIIDKIYQVAAKIKKHKQGEDFIEGRKEKIKEKMGFLQKLRERWGI
jgi:hypothetical protein